MKVETTKKLTLTKTEQRALTDFYNIMNKDEELNVYDVWEILLKIALDDDDALQYGYNIDIVD